MKQIISILTFILILFFSACEIERLPSSSVSADQIMQDPEASVSSLLNGCYGQMKGWADVMHRCGEYAGDNMMIRGASTDAFYEFISYSRTPNNYRLNTFWNNSYKIIAQSTNIMNMVKEGQSEELDHKLGECYFLRGMMYFYLCRAYGRPYYQEPEKNLGVPIVNGTPEDVINLKLPKRSTVKDTYEQVINDLERSIELMNVNKGPKYASVEAAQAILSRVYLFMSGTWENPNVDYAKKSIEYADKVINSGKYNMLSRDDLMRYNTFVPEYNKESILVVKRVAAEFASSDHQNGIGGMYGNIGGLGWGEMYASAKYLALLSETGQNDWFNKKYTDARAAFIEPQYISDEKNVFRFIKTIYKNEQEDDFEYIQAEVKQSGENLVWKEEWKDENKKEHSKEYIIKPVNKEQNLYSIDYRDGYTYEGVLDGLIKLNRVYPMFYIVKCSREGEESHLHSPVITRLAEMYLNKAEAAAKTGDYTTALAALNVVRERSLPGKGYDLLTPENAPELIEKERQLELAYQAERSYDVFRNGGSLTRKYPGPHNCTEDILPTDYRVVYYIPQDAINAYPGTLTQNPTSN